MNAKSYTHIVGYIYVIAVLASAGAVSGKELPDGARITPLVRATNRILPMVVNIGTERIVRVSDPFEQLWSEFFGTPVRYWEDRQSIPLGSGVIVDPSGLVVTNHHVVQRASTIQVLLWDRTVLSAVPVAADPKNDLALLQIQDEDAPETLGEIEFAVPGDVYLGETVVAVGNPFGLGHTVSAGVLSATNRTLDEAGVTFHDILQTDAAINPGNSGGPLVNMDGQLIGLNVSIRREAEGIGFAIPLGRIEEVLSGWLVPSRFSLGVCGLVPATRVREDGTTEAIVGGLVPGSPAAETGLEPGNVVQRVNGTPVSRALDVGRILWRLTPGDTLHLEVADVGAVEVTVRTMAPNMLLQRRLGLRVQELTPPLRRALGLPDSVRGVTISDVLRGSDFEEVGVKRGDVVYRIGDTATDSLEAVFGALKEMTPGSVVPVFLIGIESVQGHLLAHRFRVNITVQ